MHASAPGLGDGKGKDDGDSDSGDLPVLPVLIDDLLHLYPTTTSGSGSGSSGGGMSGGGVKSACGIPRSSFLRAGS